MCIQTPGLLKTGETGFLFSTTMHSPPVLLHTLPGHCQGSVKQTARQQARGKDCTTSKYVLYSLERTSNEGSISERGGTSKSREEKARWHVTQGPKTAEDATESDAPKSDVHALRRMCICTHHTYIHAQRADRVDRAERAEMKTRE